MSVGYTGGLGLAAVLVWAAVAKAFRPTRTAADFAALGLASPRMLARVLPAAELAVAALLVTIPWIGGVAALGMLAAFSVVLGERLRQGVAAPCGCFGATGDEPISAVALVRNGLLGILAAGAVMADEPTVPELADVIIVTTAMAIGAVVLGLTAMRRDVGAVWDNTLAGEETHT